MGRWQSTGPMAPTEIRRFFDPADNFAAGRGVLTRREPGYDAPLARAAEPPQQEAGCDALAAYSILGALPETVAAGDEALLRVRSAALSGGGDPATRSLDRSLGCVLGNTVGDALGAPLEFSPLRYGSTELRGMCQDDLWKKAGYNSFRLKPGQWTDDAAMGLCIVDSLICCNGLDACDLRHRFHAWNKHGYNNAFGRDPKRNSRGSVGLGGNISMSMQEWEEVGNPQTAAGNSFTNGNGSVMRNGAVPVWYRDDVEAGMAAAYQQSKTTHKGDEAAELCRLLTFICTGFINGAGRVLLDDLRGFTSPSYTVTCLANAECEERHEQNSHPVFGGLDRRRWNWRTKDFRYCEFRARENPGYIGSYAMDNMSMALHCVYTTRSFREATLKAANLRGDSDSVCAVVGQLAGALYGASAIPEDWLARVRRWDGGAVAARALMLHRRESLDPAVVLSEAACATAQLLGEPF